MNGTALLIATSGSQSREHATDFSDADTDHDCSPTLCQRVDDRNSGVLSDTKHTETKKLIENNGATDEFGLRAVADQVHVDDLETMILNVRGFDHAKFT